MFALGMASLIVAFLALLLSIVLMFRVASAAKQQLGKQSDTNSGYTSISKLQFYGSIGVWVSTLTLTLACVILLAGFLSGDTSLQYVVEHRSNSTSELSLLYKIAGLWAGREGSLLFWAWLIAVFSSLVTLKATKKTTRNMTALDCTAIAIAQLVLLAFVGLLLLGEGNNPFVALESTYLDASGALTGNAALLGMSSLLEHWAMAIHPPTLFVGYAGLTIPFAYAVAALIVNDPSKAWVERATRYALVSWLFLGIGIGLGAVWAYVVLGWGGYWGWDPVENASLLAWIVGVALVHSMTIYRQRGAFKRWSIMCACLTFAFVIVGTFISRSGIVESVHTFAANPISLVFFFLLIVAALLAGGIGLIVRHKSFYDEGAEQQEAESLVSRDVAYYLNNVIMLVCTVFLAYMTISSALPWPFPFGGQGFTAVGYNAIARPVGILYCLIIAAGPLLGWRKTGARSFFRQAWLPGVFALALFAVLCYYFATTLMPSYMQTMAQGGSAAQAIYEAGPFWYYALLTLAGFLAASLLVFNSLVLLIRALIRKNFRVQTLGGFTAHLAMGIILIGLIGSSMYVYERSGYLAYDETTDTAEERFVVKDYTLTYVSNAITPAENNDDIFYRLTFDVEKNGVYLGQVSPAVQLVQTTQQQQLHAAVLSFPTEDLFVVYRGVNDNNDFSLDVRINPLINFVWIGFGLLILGTALAALGKRGNRSGQTRSNEVVEVNKST